MRRPTRLATLLLTGLLVGALAGCATKSVRTPAGGALAVVEHAHAGNQFRFELDGRSVGEIMRFTPQDTQGVDQPERAYWSVRNRYGQELGMVDRLGRAWRRRPHAEPEWLSTGTVTEGARRILGLSSEAILVEVPLDS